MLDIPGLHDDKENVLEVIQELTHPCYDCRLGHCQKPKQNKGLIWRGNPKARIALISIMPGPKEMELGKPLMGGSGQLSDKWFKYLKLDTNKDMLVINVVQCKPPDIKKKDGEVSQRDPEQEELSVCFPTRCLRVLRAMPNLEVIIVLGWAAARCLLGGDPKDQSHMGHWYSTSLLPGKAVYCLPHPAALLRDEKAAAKSESVAYLEKRYRVMKCLDRFKRQYLDHPDKIMKLAAVAPTGPAF